MASHNVLRAVNHRLISTPVEELPHIVGFLSSSIFDCSNILRESDKNNNENEVQIHKLKTRVSSLLQDRTVEGRYTGALLAKSILEAGGITTLSESGTWSRSILSCLNKPDLPEVKKVYLVTLSRILILTLPHPSLIREIANPVLPTFLTATLNLIKPTANSKKRTNGQTLNPLLLTILRCWVQLMTRFSPTFRPYLLSVRAICLSLVGDDSCPEIVKSTACDVIARLPFCAPKNVVNTEWSQLCEHIIEAAHEVADHVFRSLVEDWSSSQQRNSKLSGKKKSAVELSMEGSDVVNMGPWTGILTGSSRLVSCIHILRSLCTSTHAQGISLPIGLIMDLCERISAVTTPTLTFSLKINPEISRDEREELFVDLPRIHVAIIELLDALTETFGQLLLPTGAKICAQILDIFEAEQFNSEIRRATYQTMTTLLKTHYIHSSKSDASLFALVIERCCNDLRAEQGLLSDADKLHKRADSLLSSDKVQKQRSWSDVSVHRSALFKAAWFLPPAFLTHGPLNVLPSAIRALLDSTAILCNHDKAMLASVLNPPKLCEASGSIKTSAPSIIPFLAASDKQNLAVEALLRPRMPPVGSALLQQDHGAENAALMTAQDEVTAFEDSHTSVDSQLDADGMSPTPPSVSQTQISSVLQGGQDNSAVASSMKRGFASMIGQTEDGLISNSTDVDGDKDKRPRTDANDPLHPSGTSTNLAAPVAEAQLEQTSLGTSLDSIEGKGKGKASKEEAREDMPAVVSVHEDHPISLDAVEANAAPAHEQAETLSKQIHSMVNQADNDETDDSDFEMPTIDTTLTTSDEDEN